MAYVSSDSFGVLSSVRAAIGSAFHAVAEFMLAISEAGARRHQIELLQGMTDRQLKDQFNIERSQIVSYVFRDKMMF